MNRYRLATFALVGLPTVLLASCSSDSDNDDAENMAGADGATAGNAGGGSAGTGAGRGGTTSGGRAGRGGSAGTSGAAGSAVGGATGGDAGARSGEGGHGGASDAGVPGSAGRAGGTGETGGEGGVAAPAGGAGGDTSSDAGQSGEGGEAGQAGGYGVSGAGGEGGAPSGNCSSVEPAIVTTGSAGLLLRGTLVTPDDVFDGEVLVENDTITCVAESCASAPNATLATVVDTGGIIFPGLIDTHNHVQFDAFDETDWTPLQTYTNVNGWVNEARYGALLDAKQYLNGQVGSPVDYSCELNKYGELKGLVAGTTSMVGTASPPGRACYGTLTRTIDQSPNGLGEDRIQTATALPTTSAADGVCANFPNGETRAYLIHIADGTDQTARNEFMTLNTITTEDGCLYAPQTAIVLGTALTDPALTTMATHDMSLVWSPRSNVFLYGGGTDLGATADIPLALSKGINVALAPDWSIGGSQNLLDELRFARQVDDTVWGSQISSQQLVEMVTTNAARVLGLEAVIGSLESGKKADIMVLRGDRCAPYDALLAASPDSVEMVMVGGAVLYGNPVLSNLAAASPPCDALNVCGRDKFVCVAAPGHTAANKFGQSLGEITGTLEAALVSYDALDLSQWDFAPLTPLVRCE